MREKLKERKKRKKKRKPKQRLFANKIIMSRLADDKPALFKAIDRADKIAFGLAHKKNIIRHTTIAISLDEIHSYTIDFGPRADKGNYIGFASRSVTSADGCLEINKWKDIFEYDEEIRYTTDKERAKDLISKILTKGQDMDYSAFDYDKNCRAFVKAAMTIIAAYPSMSTLNGRLVYFSSRMLNYFFQDMLIVVAVVVMIVSGLMGYFKSAVLLFIFAITVWRIGTNLYSVLLVVAIFVHQVYQNCRTSPTQFVSELCIYSTFCVLLWSFVYFVVSGKIAYRDHAHGSRERNKAVKEVMRKCFDAATLQNLVSAFLLWWKHEDNYGLSLSGFLSSLAIPYTILLVGYAFCLTLILFVADPGSLEYIGSIEFLLDEHAIADVREE